MLIQQETSRGRMNLPNWKITVRITKIENNSLGREKKKGTIGSARELNSKNNRTTEFEVHTKHFLLQSCSTTVTRISKSYSLPSMSPRLPLLPVSNRKILLAAACTGRQWQNGVAFDPSRRSCRKQLCNHYDSRS